MKMTKCWQCRAPYVQKSRTQKFCSPECAQAARRRFEVSAEELDRLVWSMPTVEVARRFGVSDKAIEKRCRQLFIAKPPRGYWAIERALNGGST